MRIMMLEIRDYLRDLVYPGVDLHVRNRASLAQFWRKGPRDVLDAGSGNGYFSWLSYKSGARVLALNFNGKELQKARDFLVGHRKADPERLRFEHYNLYDLKTEKRNFDEIICFEALEHIKQDKLIVTEFYRILRPGGVLHLCCPNALHPRHQIEVLDVNETGGHVRAGYTEKEYHALLNPVGFEIQTVVGIGPRTVYISDEILRKIRVSINDLVALPVFAFLLPFVWIARFNPPMPFSLYVKAKKPESAS